MTWLQDLECECSRRRRNDCLRGFWFGFRAETETETETGAETETETEMESVTEAGCLSIGEIRHSSRELKLVLKTQSGCCFKLNDDIDIIERHFKIVQQAKAFHVNDNARHLIHTHAHTLTHTQCNCFRISVAQLGPLLLSILRPALNWFDWFAALEQISSHKSRHSAWWKQVGIY